MADDRHSFWSNEGPKKEFITMKTLEPRDNYPAAQVHKQRLRTTAPVYYSAQDFERREIYNILNRSNKQIDSDKSPSKKELREHRRKRRKEKKEEIKEERKERDKQFKAYNDFYKSLTKGIECIKYTVQPGESYKTIFDAYGYTFSDFDMIKEFNIDKQNDDFPSDFETPEEGSVIFIPINHNDNIRHWWRGWKAYQDGAKGLAYRIISGKENDPFWIVDKEEETRKIRDRRWFITKLFICNRLRFIRFNARNYFFENKGEVFRIDAWKGTYPQGVGAEVGIYKLDKKRGLFLPYTPYSGKKTVETLVNLLKINML